MCRIIVYSVPEGPPYYANGSWRAVIKCEEHGMIVGAPYAQNGDLCAIGKIEKATETALAKIAAAIA